MGRLKGLPDRLPTLSARVAPLPVAERQESAGWHHLYKTSAWQRLRWKVLVRDNFTCQMCGMVEGRKGQLVADHKIPHRGDEVLFWDEGNLQCLCKTCHDSAKQRMERSGQLGWGG